MSRTNRRLRRRSRVDTPVMAGTAASLVLSGVGAFLGFEVLGGLGPVPTLILLIVASFALGAALTVWRIMSLRSSTTSAGKPEPRPK